MQNNKELKAGNCRYIDYSALKEDNPVNYTLLKKEGGTGSDRILNINKEREKEGVTNQGVSHSFCEFDRKFKTIGD